MMAAMSRIDEAALDDKLATLERVREWSPRLVAKLEALLHAPDEALLVRVNPLTFARERGVAPAEALDLFLHATRLGLFTLDWHLLCPSCGMAVESFASLRALHSLFFCSMCQIKVEASFDDYIQVSFTVAPSVRRIAYHEPESLPAEDYLFKLRFTREMHAETLDGPRLPDFLRPLFKAVAWIAPGERQRFEIEEQDGAFAAIELQAHAGVFGTVVDGAPAGPVQLVVEATELTSSHPQVRPGRIVFEVENRRQKPVVFALATKSQAMLEGPPAVTVIEPIVTGAMLLTNQTFRRLFRGETVHGADGIGVRDVTVLFTDLKGSTALYERIGDLKAFSLVHQHFDRLSAAVQANSGAIVKTIGDAVMAAFSQPADAVRAAVAMQQQIEDFNHEHGGHEIVLKIGIHRGPSIAVTLNENLDYFGHTVNVAARVQGLADANEIWVTDDVYRADGVPALLTRVESQDAQLRGIQSQVRVHKALHTNASR
jgi:class 3 adenylate cyclase